ncbi:immunoglobulin-like domain-containing protein, partial [Enterococcus faecalis]|uniref:immunoglobulin-like domain-containing protein n=1 Tax=Enterococcus faecalis TaxID=1351 RepID=UPI00046C4F6D
MKGKKTKKAVVLTATASLMANGLLGAGVVFADEQNQGERPAQTDASQKQAEELNSLINDGVNSPQASVLSAPTIEPVYEGDKFVKGDAHQGGLNVMMTKRSDWGAWITSPADTQGKFNHNDGIYGSGGITWGPFKAGEKLYFRTEMPDGTYTEVTEVTVQPKRLAPPTIEPVYEGDKFVYGDAHQGGLNVMMTNRSNWDGWITSPADAQGKFNHNDGVYQVGGVNIWGPFKAGEKLYFRTEMPDGNYTEVTEVTVQEKKKTTPVIETVYEGDQVVRGSVHDPGALVLMTRDSNWGSWVSSKADANGNFEHVNNFSNNSWGMYRAGTKLYFKVEYSDGTTSDPVEIIIQSGGVGLPTPKLVDAVYEGDTNVRLDVNTVPGFKYSVFASTSPDADADGGFTYDQFGYSQPGRVDMDAEELSNSLFKRAFRPGDVFYVYSKPSPVSTGVDWADYPKSKPLKVVIQEKDHGDSPVITATNKKYKVGSTLIPELGVSASDAEDGDLTEEITYDTSKVNMNQVGTYPLTMRVTDSDGNETTKTVDIHVLSSVAKGPRIDGATDQTLQLGDSFDPAAGVTATGFNSEDLTNEMVIQGTVNTNKEGVYQVIYTVAGRDGRVAQVVRTITVRKQTGSNPTIQATDKTYEVGSTLLPSLGVTASDQE